eukprot:7159234-Prymnesium_polylepis.1
MFEADVQPIVDEYVSGFIREEDFLMDARPWANYEQDYRGLVEFAKREALPVVAANAPRRYVGAVGRQRSTVDDFDWPPSARRFLPPLPLPRPSASYLRHLLDDPAVVRMDELGISAVAAAGAGVGDGGNRGAVGDVTVAAGTAGTEGAAGTAGTALAKRGGGC